MGNKKATINGRFFILVEVSAEAIEYQMADIFSMFVRKANDQENGNELMAIVDGATI
jgi:hypothetical protein